MHEGRIATLGREAFNDLGQLRPERVEASPDRLRVLVTDQGVPGPPFVALQGRPSDPPVVMALGGPPGRRTTRPFLLLSDRDDAAAGEGAVVAVAPGSRVEIRYRDSSAGGIRVGPSAVHEIPIRFLIFGAGVPPAAEVERAAALRIAQANAVWEPFGRRFARGPVVRLEAPRGLVLIRGRAAGSDERGRPSRCGFLLDGRELSVPAAWRNDGAPMTAKATARALAEKAGRSYQVETMDGILAGDREAVVLRIRKPDGTAPGVERLHEGSDVAQAVEAITAGGEDGIEVAPSGSGLSLEELALLASGKSARSEGFDVFIVSSLRSLQARPAFKVYPDGSFPAALAGSAVVSWPVLDNSGRYPYGLARIMGEMLMPPGVRPTADDTLFAEPLSESAGVGASKRVSAATGERIAERGRALSGGK